METLALETWGALSAATIPSSKIVHGGSNRGLAAWLPLAGLQAREWVRSNPNGVVLWGDALVASALWPAVGQRAQQSVMVMGLDLTYENRTYRRLVGHMLPRMSSVLAISESTQGLAIERGARPDAVSVVRLGVEVPCTTIQSRRTCRDSLLRRIGREQTCVLTGTLGRLVPRKGHEWFVREVLPQLPGVHYVIAGVGPEEKGIQTAADAAGVTERVSLLGRVDEHDREMLLSGLDLFVQPNVRVLGDVEGFGLVTIEAAMRDTPVVASALDGLVDAVVHDHTGRLLPSGDSRAWTTELKELTSSREHLARHGAVWGAEARSRFSQAKFRESLTASLLI